MYWIALLVPLVIVVAGLVFFVARRAPLASVELSAQGRASASAGRRRSGARLRLTLLLVPTLGAIVVGLVIASYRDADGIDGPLGRTSLLLISPLLVTTVIALLLAFVPRFGENQARRTADLSRRSPFTFVSRQASTALIVLAGVLIVAMITFGVLAWPHGESLFYFYGGGFAGGGGEFPGFGFGVPILVSLVLLVLAVWLSLFRVARAPRPTDASLREADTAVRILTSSTILAVASFAIAVSLATVLIMAGVAFSDVTRPSVDLHGNPVAINSIAQTLAVLSSAGIGVGIGLIVVAIYFLVRSISLATRSPFAINRKESVGA
jgi:uncharacterized membrane protein